MFKKLVLLFSLSFLLVGLLPAQPASGKDFLKSLVAKMNKKNIGYFVIPASGEPDGFIGINYLKGVSLIVIHSRVTKDNLPFVTEELRNKNYRKVYQDLSMMKGNTYTVVFDFMIDDLSTDSSSGDFIKENDTVHYLNRSYSDNGFSSHDEYKNFIDRTRTNYFKWLEEIDKALS